MFTGLSEKIFYLTDEITDAVHFVFCVTCDDLTAVMFPLKQNLIGVASLETNTKIWSPLDSGRAGNITTPNHQLSPAKMID